METEGKALPQDGTRPVMVEASAHLRLPGLEPYVQLRLDDCEAGLSPRDAQVLARQLWKAARDAVGEAAFARWCERRGMGYDAILAALDEVLTIRDDVARREGWGA